jgi:CBS-domain-containing membrane protein
MEASRIPFVTSIAFVILMPASALAQPRAFILAHYFSGACRLVRSYIIGPGETAGAVAAGFAFFTMLAFWAIRPPDAISAYWGVLNAYSAEDREWKCSA